MSFPEQPTVINDKGWLVAKLHREAQLKRLSEQKPKHMEAPMKKPISELRLTTLSEGRAIFETGKSVQFRWMRDKNDPYLHENDIRPTGFYMRHNVGNIIKEGYEKGIIRFTNPLVIEYEEWKQRLSNYFDGKTKKSLSKTISNEGYDGIITVYGNHTEDIVNIGMY